MKKAIKVFLSIAAAAFMLLGCAHNGIVNALGTVFRAGSAEANVMYGDGLVSAVVGRENVSISYEIDSSLGFTYDPATNTYKGIKAMRVEIGPQANGYVENMSPDALDKYYAAVGKYYESRTSKAVQQTAQAEIASTESRSNNATTAVTDIVKAAIGAVKDAKEEKQEAAAAPIKCDGSCEYSGLGSYTAVKDQRAIAAVLEKLDCNGKPAEDADTFAVSLTQFAEVLAACDKGGVTVTPMRIDSVKATDGKLEKLEFLFTKDGKTITTTCPGCCAWEDAIGK